MLFGCIRIATTYLNIGISEVVHKISFIQYLPQIMTSWKVVRIGQKGQIGVIEENDTEYV